MNEPDPSLEEKLGYRFNDTAQLNAALTHRSYRFESSDIEEDNQRLEFLGDAALGLASGSYLFRHYPEFREGQLTRLRSRITNRDVLAQIATGIQLGEYLMLGRGERRSGGHERPSNLADALEAILGAAYLDGGLEAVQDIFQTIFVPDLEAMDPTDIRDNPKGALQELAQQSWKSSPYYRTVQEDGPAHAKTFTVEVLLGDDRVIGKGSGKNKRSAETEAARKGLDVLQAELDSLDD